MPGAFGAGFATSFSLILAIGAQNAFVLRQGLLRRHVFWVCLMMAASDALLIAAGVMGFGAITKSFPSLPLIMTWAGAAFLLVYGALRFVAAWRGAYALHLNGATVGLAASLATGAALTWLNPHVYLDTLGLLGAVSTGFAHGAERAAFAVGATLASFLFFFSLGYGARYLAPVMQSARAWRWLDLGIGITMWAIAAKLVAS